MSSAATTRPSPAAPWSDFVSDAPELAAAVQARFRASRHHVLGTLRPDGAPRLSGTEVELDEAHMTLGMMPGSRKLADVRRDARIELHTAPLEEDLARGDAKIAGHLVEIEREDPDHVGAGFFRVQIRLASLVRVEGDQLVLATWRPGRGSREIRRS